MAPSFNDRRATVKENTQKVIEKALTADRQARIRARDSRKKKPDFDTLSADAQNAALEEAETAIMEKRAAASNDADSKRTAAVDEEFDALKAIDAEELEKLKALLGESAASGKENSKKRARSENDDDDDDNARISSVFRKNMVPLIEKLERQIIAGGASVAAGASAEELDDFAAQASNPEDVKAYLEKWNDENADLSEGLDKPVEEEGSDIEVVVSDDEESDDDDDEAGMEDFIVDDEEEEDDKEEEDDDDKDDDEDDDEDDEN